LVFLLFRRRKDARICDLRDFSDEVNGFIPARSKVVSGVEPIPGSSFLQNENFRFFRGGGRVEEMEGREKFA